MNFRQLEQFLAVAETGSFSRGAQRAHLSQPALSTAIGKLENDLGVQLFNRQPRQVTLTAEGLQLLPSAKKIIGECITVRAALKRTTEREVLNIGVCDTLNLPSLAATLEQFKRGHAEVRINVLEFRGDELVQQLNAGELDLIYLSQTGLIDIPKDLNTRQVDTEKFGIVMSPTHTLAGLKAAPFSVLDNEAFISRTHCENRPTVAQVWANEKIQPKVIYRTSQDQRALDLIRAGLGVGLFPASLVPDDLHILDIQDQNFERQILCCWPSEVTGPVVSAFLEFSQSKAE